MQKKISDWLEIAESDLKAAKNSLESKDYYVSVFLSQQAAEKAFKAVFVDKHKKVPPKIHDLKELANLVKAPDNVKEQSARLSPIYFVSRYPGADDRIPPKIFDIKQAEVHLKEAEVITRWCKSILN